MNLPLSMPMRPFIVSRDGHDRIIVEDETLFFASDILFELKVLVLDVLVVDREVCKGRISARKKLRGSDDGEGNDIPHLGTLHEIFK
jgi:hypothetical protein